jgi:hypothetical protein
MQNVTSPLPANVRDMTDSQKIEYIERQSRALYEMRKLLEKWEAYRIDPNPYSGSREIGSLFVDARYAGLEDFERICLTIFKGELQAKIIALDAELKSMIK